MNNAVIEVTDCELNDWGPVSKKKNNKNTHFHGGVHPEPKQLLIVISVINYACS